MEVITPLLITAVIILIGFIGNLIFNKTNVPNIIWLLMFGLALGPIFHIVDAGLFISISQFVAALAIIIILFDGGIYMDLYKLFREAPRGILLAITAFSMSMIATTIIMMVLGQPLLNALLLGAIIGGTSSPIVIPVVSKMRGLRDDTKTILSIESAITDALSIVIAIALMDAIALGSTDIAVGFQALASAFSVGAIFGVIAGLIWVPLMRKIEPQEFSYVVTLAALFLLYSGVELLNGSGAIACLLFGIVLANGRTIFKMIKYENIAFQMSERMKQFHSLIAFFIRTFFFVYLGLLVSFTNVDSIIVGMLIVLALLVVRPLAVHVSTIKGGFSKKDRHTMSIMLPRGLAAAVLAYLPLSMGIWGTGGFADIVFTVILGTSIICTVGVIIIKLKYKEEIIMEEPGFTEIKPGAKKTRKRRHRS